jgi:hypothetical protein
MEALATLEEGSLRGGSPRDVARREEIFRRELATYETAFRVDGQQRGNSPT